MANLHDWSPGIDSDKIPQGKPIFRNSHHKIDRKRVSIEQPCVRTVVERNLEMVKAIETSNISPRRKLRDLIATLMSSYGEHYPLFYIYIRENRGQVSDQRSEWSRHMRDVNRQTTDAVVAIIEQGYADKSFRNVGSARVMANGVLGVVGWTHRWCRPETSDITAEEIGNTYAELMLAGLEHPYAGVAAASAA